MADISTLASVLQYGAMSLAGLGIVYGARVLVVELNRPETKPENKYLILSYMVFCLVLFGMGMYLEVSDKSRDASVQKTLSDIQAEVKSIDGNIDAKFLDTVASQDANRKKMVHFEAAICGSVKKIMTYLKVEGASQCAILSEG